MSTYRNFFASSEPISINFKGYVVPFEDIVISINSFFTNFILIICFLFHHILVYEYKNFCVCILFNFLIELINLVLEEFLFAWNCLEKIDHTDYYFLLHLQYKYD